MPLPSFFSFLSRGEKGILQEILANLNLAIDSSEHLLSLVKELKLHEFGKVREEIDLIIKLESEGDIVHMKAVERICSGSFFGGIREDLLVLLEKIDNITDNAKNASEIFAQRRISEEAIDFLFKEDVVGFVQVCVETVKLFRDAVVSIGKSKQEVIRLSTAVERKEEEADKARSPILSNLLKNEINANVLDIVMLKDFLNASDNIADSAEDGSDVLLILVTKGYT